MDYRAYCLDLLKELVAIPSESQNEEAIARFLYSWLRDMGMQARLQHVSGKSYNIIAGMKGKRTQGQGKKWILGGHIDTVSRNNRWETDPYCLTADGDRLYGLGAGDMKGGLAAQITVLKKLLDSGSDFSGEIEFIGLADEERHSIGANAYVKEKKKEEPADFAIFAEPHYDNIVTGATGKILLKLQVQGKTGHAAVPETGINAIDCMAQFLAALNRTYMPMYLERKAASFCVLQITSRYEGYCLNIPEECCALLNKQLTVEESADDFIRSLKDLYQKHVGKGIFTVTKEIPCYPSYQISHEEKHLQKLLEVISEQNCEEPELRMNQSVSDGNVLYSELGIPTILFGPQGIDFHKENEYLLKSTLFSYMEILEQFIQIF